MNKVLGIVVAMFSNVGLTLQYLNKFKVIILKIYHIAIYMYLYPCINFYKNY